MGFLPPFAGGKDAIIHRVCRNAKSHDTGHRGSSGDTAVKYCAGAQCEVTCASSVRRHVTAKQLHDAQQPFTYCKAHLVRKKTTFVYQANVAFFVRKSNQTEQNGGKSK